MSAVLTFESEWVQVGKQLTIGRKTKRIPLFPTGIKIVGLDTCTYFNVLDGRTPHGRCQSHKNHSLRC